MRFYFVFILLFLSGFDFVLGDDKPKIENEYVTASITLRPSKLRAGNSGELLISLKPKKGIHINLQPKAELKLEISDAFILTDSLIIPKSKKTGFVDSEKPIRQMFKLSPKLSPGTVTLNGTLTYYYCSDAEGWCSKFKQPIQLKAIVKK